MRKLFVEDLKAGGKRVIVRVDFNVPIRNGRVESDKRLRASLPTVRFLRQQGARVILMTHLGRPKGQVVEELRTGPVARALSVLLSAPVGHVPVCVGPEAEAAAAALKDGDVLLLENLRFYPEEEANDAGFAKQLSSLADLYVNDAFGTAHRAHASTEGITHYFKQCAAGHLLKAELDYLHGALDDAARPFIAVVGGAKVSSKMGVIRHLLEKTDRILLGGAMTHNFLKARGLEIGRSVYEPDSMALTEDLLKLGGDRLILPQDYVVSDVFDFKARTAGEVRTVAASAIPADAFALDIGPAAQASFRAQILEARTILWNGPMGVFEIDALAAGTFAVAHALADATAKGAVTVVGGGDSSAAIEKAGLEAKVSHVSTGGGASLEFLEGKHLPGVMALTDV